MATKDNMMNKEINKEMTEFVKPLIPLSIENDLEKGSPTSNRKVQGDIPPTFSEPWCCCCCCRDVVLVINYIVTYPLLFLLFGFLADMISTVLFSNWDDLLGGILCLIQICAMVGPYICGIYGATNYKLWGVIVATIMHSLVGSIVILFVASFDNDNHVLTAFFMIIIGLILFPHFKLIKELRNKMTSDVETNHTYRKSIEHLVGSRVKVITQSTNNKYRKIHTL